MLAGVGTTIYKDDVRTCIREGIGQARVLRASTAWPDSDRARRRAGHSSRKLDKSTENSKCAVHVAEEGKECLDLKTRRHHRGATAIPITPRFIHEWLVHPVATENHPSCPTLAKNPLALQVNE